MEKVEAIEKYMEHYSGDGHTIIRAEALVEWGFSKEIVDRFSYEHKSDGTAKGSITSSVDGKVLDKLMGVYTLDFAYAIARDIGADTKPAGMKMGRGFQAQELAIAIRARLAELAKETA